METFSAWLALCAGNSPVTGEFPSQRPVTRSSDVFFDLYLDRRLSKQSRRWWFETYSLWHYCNVTLDDYVSKVLKLTEWVHQLLFLIVMQCRNISAARKTPNNIQLIQTGRSRSVNWPYLGQVMACHLFGTKQVPIPVLTCCQLDPQEHISVTFLLKFRYFHLWNFIWKGRPQNVSHYCLGLLFSFVAGFMTGIWNHNDTQGSFWSLYGLHE